MAAQTLVVYRPGKPPRKAGGKKREKPGTK
jgi:hypothetical protein